MASQDMPIRNLYMGMPGATLGTRDKFAPQVNAEEWQINQGDLHVSEALAIGGQASPLMGLVVFAVLLIVIGWLAKRYGGGESFSNIKLSAYSVLFIALAASIGLPIIKFIFTRVKVPGVSTWILAA